MSEQQRTNINVGTTALEKQYIIYVLPINKISNQNSHICLTPSLTVKVKYQVPKLQFFSGI